MTLRRYTYVWFFLTILITADYVFMKRGASVLLGAVPGVNPSYLNPEAGRPLSLLLGWTGFGLMLTTNLYILRKRLGILKNLGNLQGWLDFHIFCGLMGPTLIVFHTNFRVRGLVSISFWSMMTVAISGVVGRYFYGQVIRKKTDLLKEAQSLAVSVEKAAVFADPGFRADSLAAALESGARWVGCRASDAAAGLFSSMSGSLVGDLRVAFRMLPSPAGMPSEARPLLRDYGLALRRAQSFENFQRLLGYWHSFHLPFAYFMYAVAVVHIISAMLFGVSK